MPWPDKIISNETNIDFDNSSAKAIYENYQGMQGCRTTIFNYSPTGLDYYDRELYDSLVNYITSNFVTYDRGVIQKEVEKVFGKGYDYLVEQICNDISDENTCGE